METKRLEVTAEGKKVYDIVIENNFNQLVKELSVFGIKVKIRADGIAPIIVSDASVKCQRGGNAQS